MAENKEYITNQLENGSISINEEVVATIVTAAVKDVEGVVSLSGNLGDDLAGMLGKKNNNKGIRIDLTDDGVEIVCSLVVLYGHSVVEIAKNVQKNVTSAVESMAGLTVKSIDVNICGIAMSK